MLFLDLLGNRPRCMSQAMVDVGNGQLEAASLDYLVEILTSEKDYSTLKIVRLLSWLISLNRQNRLRHISVNLPQFCHARATVE